MNTDDGNGNASTLDGQQELFVCDLTDVMLKDIIPQMEHPFFTLSKHPDTAKRKYINGKYFATITPSSDGMPTIYDKDLLVFAISQAMDTLNKGGTPSKTIRIYPKLYMEATHRGMQGSDYRALDKAMTRLHGVSIQTNVRSGDYETVRTFGLINGSTTKRKYNKPGGRLEWVDIDLSDWVFAAIEAKAVLTLNRDYFRLKRPLFKRLYEIARKHCGNQRQFRIRLDTLFKKTGKKGGSRELRRELKKIMRDTPAQQRILEYRWDFNIDDDMVTFTNLEWRLPNPKKDGLPVVSPEEIKAIHVMFALIEDETPEVLYGAWIAYWQSKGSVPIRHPGRAFTKWAQQRFDHYWETEGA